MRKIATVKDSHSEIKRVMIHELEGGAYLFAYISSEDGPAASDLWFQSALEAEDECARLYGVASGDWIAIDDPLDGCQQDWIAPVRVKGRDVGNPLWGTFERLEQDGTWQEIRQNIQ